MSASVYSLPKRIAVTGATGWLGQAICRYLNGQGVEIVALNQVEAFGVAGVSVLTDIATDEEMAAAHVHPALDGVGTLIHCAGYAHRPIETPEEVERFFAINRDGTRRVVELCRARGIDRVVYLSSIAFYDWKTIAGSLADEESPLATPTAYARSKLDGEQLVRESGLDWRVVRLATVYGAGDRANFAKLAGALRTGRFVMPGAGSARKSVIEVDIAASCICRLAGVDEPAHRLINLAQGPAPTLSEICRAYCACCGFASPHRLPMALYQLLAAAGSVVSLVKPGFPLTLSNVSKITTSTQVDIARMRAVLPDFEPVTFKDSLARSADWYKGGSH